MKIALITGITGQDGSYLADFLLEKGYEVHGLVAQRANPNWINIAHIVSKLNLHIGDLTDQNSIQSILNEVKPDEIYNLAAQSFVKTSWDMPEMVANVNSLGVLRILEAIRKECPYARFYQASSSEMFGKVIESPQKETTRFHPRSPYGVSKLYGHWITVNYRESFGLHASSGILFNHDSPRRGDLFVTQKIAKAAAKIKLGTQDILELGCLTARRDIGYAPDYVEAMWLMLQQETPDDYVIATGETHSIEEMCEICFNYCGLNWKDYVTQSAEFQRPAEVDLLLGDAAKAKKKLGWEPKKKFKEILELMTEVQLGLKNNDM